VADKEQTLPHGPPLLLAAALTSSDKRKRRPSSRVGELAVASRTALRSKSSAEAPIDDEPLQAVLVAHDDQREEVEEAQRVARHEELLRVLLNERVRIRAEQLQLPNSFLFSGRSAALHSSQPPLKSTSPGPESLPPIVVGNSPAKSGRLSKGEARNHTASPPQPWDEEKVSLQYTPQPFAVRVHARPELAKLAQYSRIDADSLGYKRIYGNLFMKKEDIS
jgi:hypothetical protein